MRKTIRFSMVSALFVAIATILLSFSVPILNLPSTIPAPSYTTVEISDIPSLYAIRVDLVGPWFDDNTYTVYSTYNIAYNPSSPISVTSDEKYYYSAASEHTTASVYVKATSTSSWSFVGSINTDDNRVTKTTGGCFLQKMSFDYDDLPNP